MKRLNFKELAVYTSISKNEKVTGDARESFSNVIYSYMSGIRAKDLALRIFNSSGDVSMSDDDIELIRQTMNRYCTPAFIDAIEEQLKND